jgi:hypothetical protein
MKDLEEILKRLPLTPAPERLDRKVHCTIQEAQQRRSSMAAFPIPLWACACACLLCLGIGIGVARLLAPPADTGGVTVVWSVEDPAFRRIFAHEKEPTEFFLRKKIIVGETQPSTEI